MLQGGLRRHQRARVGAGNDDLRLASPGDDLRALRCERAAHVSADEARGTRDDDASHWGTLAAIIWT